MLDRIEFETEHYVIHVYLEHDEAVKHVEADRLLKEAAKGKGEQLVGRYFYRADGPHVQPPIGKHHLHVYKNKEELFAINWDGTPHDGYRNVEIPKPAYDAIQQKFPDLKLPANRIIESFCPVTVGKMFATWVKVGISVENMNDLQKLLKEASE